jgi:hypothetical protein
MVKFGGARGKLVSAIADVSGINKFVFAQQIEMNAAQIQHQITESSKGLPKEILQEILDFIQFLKAKRVMPDRSSLAQSLSALDASERTHIENEFADYKRLYPIA